jgi:hypothetical protein
VGSTDQCQAASKLGRASFTDDPSSTKSFMPRFDAAGSALAYDLSYTTGRTGDADILSEVRGFGMTGKLQGSWIHRCCASLDLLGREYARANCWSSVLAVTVSPHL